MNMRKEKPFPTRKVEVIDQLKETISAYPHFYLVDVTALDSVATSELRRKCFKSNVKMVVVKNSLLHKAFEASDLTIKSPNIQEQATSSALWTSWVSDSS